MGETYEVEDTVYPGQQEKPVITEQDKKDVDNCTKEIMEALMKYNCDIAVAMLVTAAGNEPQVQIVKKSSAGMKV